MSDRESRESFLCAVMLAAFGVLVVGMLWALRPDEFSHGAEIRYPNGAVARPLYSRRHGFLGWEVDDK